MRTIMFSPFLILVANAGLAGEAKELDALQGTWTTNRQAAAGAGHNTDFYLFLISANSGKAEIKRDKLVTWVGKEPRELTIVLDPAKQPRWIDGRIGKDKVVFRGIYEVTEGTLRLCVSGMGDRPREFKDSLDTPLFEFKRK